MENSQIHFVYTFGSFNHDNSKDNHSEIIIPNPLPFYKSLFTNYQNPKELLHYIDCTPCNTSTNYRRLWFDLDYHQISNDFSFLTDSFIHEFIEEICNHCIHYYNQEFISLVYTKKEVNKKTVHNEIHYSWGIHIYTNWFVNGDYLFFLYNSMILNTKLVDLCKMNNLDIKEFIDYNVIGKPRKNNGCMFLGCSKDNSPSTYKLYEEYTNKTWKKIEGEIDEHYYFKTLLNYKNEDDLISDIINPIIFYKLKQYSRYKRYYARLNNCSRTILCSIQDIKDIPMLISTDTILDTTASKEALLERYLLLIGSIEDMNYFESHNTWYKLCCAAKQICNTTRGLELFKNYSLRYGHDRSDDVIESTWNHIQVDPTHLSNNYILKILMDNKLFNKDDDNDFIFMSILECIQSFNLVDSQTLVMLFQLLEFNEIVSIILDKDNFILYTFDEYNILRRCKNNYDINFFETKITTFMKSIVEKFKLSRLYSKENEQHQKIVDKIMSASVTNEYHYKEWLNRYLKTYGKSYKEYLDTYMVHKERVIYTQLGYLYPKESTEEDPRQYYIQPYHKEDMVFEDLLIDTEFNVSWNINNEQKDIIQLFEQHIARYCEFDKKYESIMLRILTTAFYVNTQKTVSYILYGSTGSNGKTITTDLISRIVGSNQCIIVNPDNLEETSIAPKIVDMSNKTMYYMNELIEEDVTGRKKTFNPFSSKVFKEIAEKKEGASARKLFSNIFTKVHFTGTLFMTSNIQPTAVNAGPIERRVCFLPSCCRYFPPGNANLYEDYVDHNLPKRQQTVEKRLKPNHYEMDYTLSDKFYQNRSIIFSYLVSNYFYSSMQLDMHELDNEYHISECKKRFFDRSTEGYDLKSFVDNHITIDPYYLNVVTIEDIFNSYKKVNNNNQFTIKKDLDKFTNALFGCLSSKDTFNSIDIVNIHRKHTSNFYKGGNAIGICGLMIDNTYNNCVDTDLFCLSNCLSKKEEIVYSEDQYHNTSSTKRILIDNTLYAIPN
ncbi:hypothetical protein WA158_006098 [Blastocystis sp. Blastoise]